MAFPVVMGATLQCSFGLAPSTFVVLPVKRVMVENKPVANMMDHAPIVNVPPFGMCNTLSNPTVATATTAALGVLTPMPCVPVIPAPWAPPLPTVLIGGQPAFDNNALLNCIWGGVIKVVNPGAVKTQVP